MNQNWPPFFARALLSDSRALDFRRGLDAASRWLRHCAVCGAFGLPTDLLCESCEERLGLFANGQEALRQSDYPFPVYSLFTWTREKDRWLRPVLYAMKGGRQPRFLQKWLERLSYLRGIQSSPPYRPVMVIPPRRPTLSGLLPREHGWMIGQILAEIWQTEKYDGLRLKRPHVSERRGLWQTAGRISDRQKAKTRGERFQMRFEALGEMKEFQGVRTIVFVDDVITTGATALAAYMALEDPHSFEVWTLVCRPKLALNPRV